MLKKLLIPIIKKIIRANFQEVRKEIIKNVYQEVKLDIEIVCRNFIVELFNEDPDQKYKRRPGSPNNTMREEILSEVAERIFKFHALDGKIDGKIRDIVHSDDVILYLIGQINQRQLIK